MAYGMSLFGGLLGDFVLNAKRGRHLLQGFQHNVKTLKRGI